MEERDYDIDDSFKRVNNAKDQAEEKVMTADELNYQKAKSRLICVSTVTLFMCIAQGIGGYLANSIAMMTDTVHLATDMIGFAISIIALQIS